MQDVNLKQLFYGAVTVGERGQVVIPSEARRAGRMEPGDKLLVFGHPMGWGLFLTKVEDLQSFLADIHHYLSTANEHVEESE